MDDHHPAIALPLLRGLARASGHSGRVGWGNRVLLGDARAADAMGSSGHGAGAGGDGGETTKEEKERKDEDVTEGDRDGAAEGRGTDDDGDEQGGTAMAESTGEGGIDRGSRAPAIDAVG
eukprot:CAMPEP_0171402152 /NCGR_PEP_ID=MMETSP0880-20121228/8366_1 /TAXON_ID=67004 /ORGANISM="Thalassiosira weissflogii, Strain CCMP1336" /LENGTH=119 /DNA_ID=CAMNT_0011916769 /DNA_START=104 /DNA_END=459 /DNA_ORIENTATION=+